MSDRDLLLGWLASAAARLRWSRRARELGRLACVLVALWLLAEILEILGAPSPVLSALFPLLILSAIASVLLFAWRLARPTTLAQAAGAADDRAGLNDELKSAHWFAQDGARDAFVDLLFTRAAKTAGRLDVRRVFPVGVPRSALAAFALVLVTGALAWLSPRLALPGPREPTPAPAPVAIPGHAARAAGESPIEKIAAELYSPTTTGRDPAAEWSKLDAMTNELPPGAERQAIKRALAARDARLVSQLLQALQRKRAAAAEQEPAADQQDRQTLAGVAQSNAGGRVPEVSSQEGKAPRDPVANAASEGTARVRQKLREQMREENRKLQGTPTQGDVTLNNRLRAVSRNSTRMREVAYGEGEAAEAGSQTSVDGAAVGERTGRSRSGGSEGEHPQSSPTGPADTQPVLGARTARLEAQVQEMRVERSDDPQRQETEESFYAATQRQASQLGYEGVAAQSQVQREAALASSQTPMSYREAVKRYFLSQHAKED
jgi:hypothetical protein